MTPLLFIFLSLCCNRLAAESCTVHVKTSDDDVYIPVVLSSFSTINHGHAISFAVKTCNHARIALSSHTSTSALTKTEGAATYEIIIGGWSNTQSVIRKAKQDSNPAVKKSYRPLNCYEFRRFYVRWWRNGDKIVIEVGIETEDTYKPGFYVQQRPFLSYSGQYYFAIKQVFVSGWTCHAGIWIFETPCVTLEPTSGLFEVHMKTPDLYHYVPVVLPKVTVADLLYISFCVKICSDAHIALSTSTSTSDLDKGVDMYEIVIGGWSNTQSVIRKAKQGYNLAVKKDHKPLDCNEFRWFYVSWGSGVIEVGVWTEKGGKFFKQPPFMSYRDLSPHFISQIFVSGWKGHDGEWKMKTPYTVTPRLKHVWHTEVWTPESYLYVPVAVPPYVYIHKLTYISFAVKTCHDAHIVLSVATSTSDLDKGVGMYEIVIGGWSNTQSVIRKAKQGYNLAVKKDHRPLNCHHFKRFYVRWGYGVIEVGEQTETGQPYLYFDKPPFMCYYDFSVPAINQVFVSGWNGRGGLWSIDFPYERLPPKSGSCDVIMRTPDTYTFIPVVVPSYIKISEEECMYFAVKICNDAHIALSTKTRYSYLGDGHEWYNIIIGRNSNTQSAIRKARHTHDLAVSKAHTPLHCNLFRRFYVRWGGRVIRVGARMEVRPGIFQEQPPFLYYKFHHGYPAVIIQVFVAGYDCQDGVWKIEFPCKPKAYYKKPMYLPGHNDGGGGGGGSSH